MRNEPPAVREDDAEPEPLVEDESMVLEDGDVIAILVAVKVGSVRSETITDCLHLTCCVQGPGPAAVVAVISC
jgi:hypothetical protein